VTEGFRIPPGEVRRDAQRVDHTLIAVGRHGRAIHLVGCEVSGDVRLEIAGNDRDAPLIAFLHDADAYALANIHLQFVSHRQPGLDVHPQSSRQILGGVAQVGRIGRREPLRRHPVDDLCSEFAVLAGQKSLDHLTRIAIVGLHIRQGRVVQFPAPILFLSQVKDHDALLPGQKVRQQPRLAPVGGIHRGLFASHAVLVRREDRSLQRTVPLTLIVGGGTFPVQIGLNLLHLGNDRGQGDRRRVPPHGKGKHARDGHDRRGGYSCHGTSHKKPP